jgi:hypothetical protein
LIDDLLFVSFASCFFLLFSVISPPLLSPSLSSFSSFSSLFQYYNEITVAADVVRKTVGSGTVAIVLGSGLSDFAKQLQDSKVCYCRL